MCEEPELRPAKSATTHAHFSVLQLQKLRSVLQEQHRPDHNNKYGNLTMAVHSAKRQLPHLCFASEVRYCALMTLLLKEPA
jgi:hypothetical protein